MPGTFPPLQSGQNAFGEISLRPGASVKETGGRLGRWSLGITRLGGPSTYISNGDFSTILRSGQNDFTELRGNT